MLFQCLDTRPGWSMQIQCHLSWLIKIRWLTSQILFWEMSWLMGSQTTRFNWIFLAMQSKTWPSNRYSSLLSQKNLANTSHHDCKNSHAAASSSYIWLTHRSNKHQSHNPLLMLPQPFEQLIMPHWDSPPPYPQGQQPSQSWLTLVAKVALLGLTQSCQHHS